MNAVSKIDPNAEKIETPVLDRTGPVSVSVTPEPDAEAVPAKPKRRGGRFLLMALVPLALVAGGSYFWITGGRYQETENASLRQARVTIAADTAGRIITSNVQENGPVRQGDVLFEVDPQPYRIALEQADAALAAARLDVGQLRAAYGQAVAQKSNTAGQVSYLESELARQSDLTGKGVTTQSALDSARRNLQQAKDQDVAAAAAVEGAKAALGGNPDIPTDEHPAVQAALASRDKAALQLDQTVVRAPGDGIVSQASSFKVGQYVAPGSALFSLVETRDAWIEANLKETQLTNVKVGQEAEVVLDTYPDRTFTATVESLGAGTGAEFSLLPAQNATGNWVKVTQRIPVRLKLQNADSDVALRTGMSATVTIDTQVSRGLPDFAAWL